MSLVATDESRAEHERLTAEEAEARWAAFHGLDDAPGTPEHWRQAEGVWR